MPLTWTSIPIRTPGVVDVSWWNTLRTAILEVQTILGVAGIPAATFTIANNQVAAADVTGILFSSATAKSAKISALIRRRTATASSEVLAWVTIYVAYREQTSAWEILTAASEGDDHGVTFSITAAGQLQYVSTSISGATYVAPCYFKAETFAP